MPETIIVPLDGSGLSESALPVAAAVARRVGAGMVLLTAGWGSTAGDLRHYLETQAANVGGDLAVSTKVVADRFPATAIVDQLEAASDAVVCMATHGRSGIGKALLGSVAEDLLTRTEHAVLLLGPKAEARTDPTTGPLVVCCDGSDTSASIAETATHWAIQLGLAVVVVTVTKPGGAVVGGDESSQVDEVVSGIVERIRAAGAEARHERLVAENAADAIGEFAAASSAAMVAMATHGRTGVARTAMGSVAMKVVHTSACPVLVVRPHAS